MKNKALRYCPFFFLAMIGSLALIAHGQEANTVRPKESVPVAEITDTNGTLRLTDTTNRMMLGQKSDEPFPVARLLERGFKESGRQHGIWEIDRIRMSEVKNLVGVEISDLKQPPSSPAFGATLYARFKNGYCLIQTREGLGDTNLVKLTINTNLPSSEKELSPKGNARPVQSGSVDVIKD